MYIKILGNFKINPIHTDEHEYNINEGNPYSNKNHFEYTIISLLRHVKEL
jgi:hypothetical protein